MILEWEMVGETELFAHLENLGPDLRRILVEQMGAQVQALRDVVRDNLSSYAPSTLENHGPTGKLADSLQTNVEDGGDTVTGSVWPDQNEAPYAAAQEQGYADGGTISATLAPFMRFIYQGDSWVTKTVSHGVTPAKHYLSLALESYGPEALRQIEEAILAAVHGAGA